MALRWVFLGAYACSGFAGLIYEASWTRLLTLQPGHSTAAVLALGVPFELAALNPLLGWSYRNGVPNIWFPIIRLLSSLSVTMVPALALGATFPIAVR